MIEELVHQVVYGEMEPGVVVKQLAALNDQEAATAIQSIMEWYQKKDKITVRDLTLVESAVAIGLQRKVITIDKDLIYMFERDNRIAIWIACVKAAVASKQNVGLLDKLRLGFAKRVKKQSRFWGYYGLQKFYTFLATRDKQFQDKFNKQHHENQVQMIAYICQFMWQNPNYLPVGHDLREVLMKFMCMLREDQPEEKLLFQMIVESIIGGSLKGLPGLRFCFEFFRYPFDDKTSPYAPHKALFQLMCKISVDQLSKQIDNTFVGMIWTEENYRYSIKNLLKVGIIETSVFAIMKIKDNALRNNMVEPLVQLTQSDLLVAFIYLKFQNLFRWSFELLKQFVLGSHARARILEQVVAKSKAALPNISPKYKQQFIQFLEAVKLKYQNICTSEDLNKLLEGQTNRPTEKQLKQLLEKHDWVNFQTRQGIKLHSNAGLHFRGLCNIGNSCYMNSFLQALYMTRQFRLRILDANITNKQKTMLEKVKDQELEEKKKELKIIRQRMVPLVQLQKLFALLYKSKRPYINPSFLKNILPLQFRNFFQHDAGEFGRLFLSSIQEVEELCYEGTQQIIVQCTKCGHQRSRAEKFLDIILPPQGSAVQSVGDMLRGLRQPQEVDGVDCEKCEQRMKSTKRTRIGRIPPYLILTLNRFAYNAQLKKKLKLSYKVQIAETLQIEQWSGALSQCYPYDLYAIIVHRGTTSQSGHYYTFTRADIGAECGWICFDDSTITQMESLAKVNELIQGSPTDTPYILFYQNRLHIEKMLKDKLFTTPFILSAKLTAMIQKQDVQYMKQSQQQKPKFQLPKIPFSSFIKKDDSDDQTDKPGPGGRLIM